MAHPGSLGEHKARGEPCSKPAACPTRRPTAVPAPPHRLRWVGSATRRSGAAVRCEAVVRGHPMWWRPSAKGAHELHGLHTCQGLPRPPTARWHEPAGTDERPARRSTVHGARTPPGGGPESPTGARTARRASEPGAAARERVLLVCLRRGINSVLPFKCAMTQNQRLGGVLGTVGGRNGPRDHPRAARHAPRARRRA